MNAEFRKVRVAVDLRCLATDMGLLAARAQQAWPGNTAAAEVIGYLNTTREKLDAFLHKEAQKS